MATIDLVDNFQVTRKQMSKQVDRPSLQSFRKDSVVGVGTRAHADVPGLHDSRWEHAAKPLAGRVRSKMKIHSYRIPPKFLLIDQNPHQLRDCHCWVGVIQLDSNLHMQNNSSTTLFSVSFTGTRKGNLWSNNKWGAFSFLNVVWYLLHLVRQFAEIGASNFPGAKLGDLETADDVLQGGRYYKVLLLQTELLSFKELWVRTHICVFIPRRQR